MKARLAELERQKAEIEARLRAGEPKLPDVNPNVAKLYRRKVKHLAEALARGRPVKSGGGRRPAVIDWGGRPHAWGEARRGQCHVTRPTDEDPRFRQRRERARNDCY
jgi:hypothetical protein